MLVNESRVLTLRASVARLTPTQRATLAAKRLAGLAHVQQISSRAGVRGILLLANNRVILQVDPADAAAYQTDVASLAGQWKEAINEALRLPPFEFGVPSVTVGEGRSVLVPLKGRNANWTAFSTADPGVVAIERSKLGLLVRGKSVGATQVRSQDRVTLDVRVLPVVAQFPQAFKAEVVGSPTSAQTVTEAIAQTLQTRFRALPGTTYEVVSSTPVTEVSLGETEETTLHIRASGANALPSEGNVTVHVRNLGIERSSETELWYSNDPERVTRPQDLFHGGLLPDRPVRLLYHHLNDSPLNLLLRVQLVNRSSLPARLVSIQGYAKPNPNPVVAGLDAAEQFFRSWLDNSGNVLIVPPHSKLTLAACPMDHNMTASGLYTLRLLPGGAAHLGVDVEAILNDGANPVPMGVVCKVEGSQPLPRWQLEAPPATTEVYEHPFCDASVSYRVGGTHGFLRLGDKPLLSSTSKMPLYGNFGVVYRVLARAENPTTEPTDVEVVFESSAGYSGGLFLIGDQLRRINPLQPQEQVQLARFHLEPGEQHDVKLMTLPLSGSAYPALLVVRTVSRG